MLTGLKPCCFLLFWLLFLPLIGLSQQYSFRNYNIEDGLAQSQVRSILQDRDGYLWIGTEGGGVSRFDGQRFVNYTTKDGLPDNTILTIYEDHLANIWFGTKAGACKYDGQTFTPVTLKEGLPGNSVRCILEDRDHRLWFATDQGACRYDGTRFTSYKRSDGLASNSVLSLLSDRTGGLWFGTDGGGASRYDGRSFHTYTKAEGLSDNTVFAMAEDHAGNIWFGTHGGLSRYDHKTVTNFTTKNGLESNIIKALLRDHKGNLWVGTEGGGLAKYDGRYFKHFGEQNGLSGNTVWALLEDHENNIWVGTYRGGLDRFNGEAFTQYAMRDGPGDDVVRSIYQDKEGNLWFATFRSGVVKHSGGATSRYTTRDGLVNNFVLTVFEDSRGNLWFGTYGGLSRFDGRSFKNLTRREGLSNEVIRSIAEDRRGNLWFGTNGGGIARYDGASLVTYTVKDGVNSNEIMALLVDQGGNIWIGTTAGICKFDGGSFVDMSREFGVSRNDAIFSILEDGDGSIWLAVYGKGIVRRSAPSGGSGATKRYYYTSDNVLSNDNVVSLCFDNAGNLWVGTERGLEAIALGEGRPDAPKAARHYGREEGFSGIECIQNAICRDSRGHMWFGTLRGAFKYQPEEDRRNAVAPSTHITAVSLFLENQDWSRLGHGTVDRYGLPAGLRLPHDRNHLSFSFIGVSLTDPTKVRYRYRLSGFDRDWSPVMAADRVTYANLPPGNYTFCVEARNASGVWNEKPAVFSFAIAYPFWRTWWFYIVATAAGAGGIYLMVALRTRRLVKTTKALEEKVHVRTAEIRSAKEALESAHNELERRVLERTRELAQANQMLTMQIKERLEAETALRASEEQYRTFFEDDLSGDFVSTLEGKLVACNPSFARLFGYDTVRSAMGADVKMLYRDPVEWRRMLTALRRRERIEGRDLEMRRPGGQVVNVIENIVGIYTEEGELIQLKGYLLDITERKRLEAQLLQAMKMEAIGRLAGGIAHDFNNLLTVINGYADMGMNGLEEMNPLYADLSEIREAGNRASALTRQLLAFSRRQILETKVIDLNTVARAAEKMLRRIIGEDITLVTDTAENLGAIKADPAQIEQIILNLAVNARDAMPRGGKLTIRTDNVDARECQVEIGASAPAAGYVLLSVCDTGVGMTEDIQAHIFEPFFTTKEKGKGTGLGLSTVYGIVTQSDGLIQVESAPGKGACFKMYFPRVEDEATTEPSGRRNSIPAGTEAILVVEDENSVRLVAERILKNLGYAVLAAKDGEEAISILEDRSGFVDLVITDVVMPGMSGRELGDRALEIDPRIKILFMSGYTDDSIVRHGVLDGELVYVQKPFTPESIGARVREILDRR